MRYDPLSEDGRRAGTYLAGGFKAIPWSCIGDLEYFNQRLGLPHHGLKQGPCALCKCTGGYESTSWRDCRPTAPWMSLQWTPASWASWAGKSTCVLFEQVKGLTAMNASYDYMHSKHLGTDAVAFGSILHILVFSLLPDSPLTNLQTCWAFIQQQYKDLGITERFRSFRKLSMFERKKGGPKLKGRAMQIAAFNKPLLALWCHHMQEDLAVHQQIRTYLRLNCKMEAMMKDLEHELAFPEPQAQTFKDCAFCMAQLHRSLHVHFSAENGSGSNLFADIPKIHMVLHAALQSGCLNPRLTWCYKGEDAMKIASTLAASCAKGLSGPQVSLKMVNKLRIAWHLRLKALEVHS